MNINTRGSHNRVASKDFQENHIQIARFDGRQIFHVTLPTEQRDNRCMVKAQRKELDALVDIVAKAEKTRASVIWLRVQAEIGVSSIDDIKVHQFRSIRRFLRAMLARSENADAKKALVRLLLSMSEEHDIQQKLIQYCYTQFSTGRLNELTFTQLKLILAWLSAEDDNVQSIPTASLQPLTPIKLSFIELIYNYPIKISTVFLAGVSMGVLICCI